MYLQSEYIEKCQYDPCSKYDREHDFDVILRSIVPCRNLRWICRKHSNDVASQVETPDKATITRCDLSATNLFKLVDSYLIAFKFAQ